MNALLNISDFEGFKAISGNTNWEKKLLPYVFDAQNFDLKELLGNAFYLSVYKDVIAEPSLVLYSDLWNGCEWTVGSHTYRHEGLKVVLINFAYYRFVMNANSHETAYGIVSKINPESESVSEKTIQRKIDNAKSSALAYWSDVECYLNDNLTTYPLWNSSCNDGENKKTNVSGVMVDYRNNFNFKYVKRKDRYGN